MYTTILFFTLVSATAVFGGYEPRIVGGHNAEPGKYLYQAQIRRANTFVCGGSIISKNFILTAAHCIYLESPKDYKVAVGSYSIHSVTNVYHAKRLIYHKYYDDTSLINDIGLIELTDNIVFNINIQPIRLPTKNVIPEEKAVVAGWGRTSTLGPISPYLQEIYLTVITREECEKYWRFLNLEDKLCTFTKIREGVCKGDSGSPLAVNGTQVGIVSFGKPCAQGIPDAYTNVYYHKKWILTYVTIDEPNTANLLSTWIPMLVMALISLHLLT